MNSAKPMNSAYPSGVRSLEADKLTNSELMAYAMGAKMVVSVLNEFMSNGNMDRETYNEFVKYFNKDMIDSGKVKAFSRLG